MPQAPILLAYGLDLRLAGHPALHAAAATGAPVIPVFVLDHGAPGAWVPGGASRWWLHGSLVALDASLRRCGSRLILRRGGAVEELLRLVGETGASAVYITRRYEPWAVKVEADLERALKANGAELRRFGGSLLFEPERIRTQGGGPFKVFTPFWRAAQSAEPPRKPKAAPKTLAAPGVWPATSRLSEWALRPAKPDWAAGLRSAWTPGEAGARQALDAFLADAVTNYGADRDRPDRPGTSRLSPHLHFGEIAPATLWHAAMAAGAAAGGSPPPSTAKWLTEIGWREFSYHLLFQFPALPDAPFRPGFARFAWRGDPASVEAWCKGLTGYPLVDAGMRQLRHTGWMHNRVRMVAASFLVKHLLIPWQQGEAWFWDNLVDADLAANAASWQWVAGCGADAAPYFRIFNPVKQGQSFDPDGTYVRHWVPELAKLSAAQIHAPWLAPEAELAAAGVQLAQDYPRPIIDHADARSRALAALKEMSQVSG